MESVMRTQERDKALQVMILGRFIVVVFLVFVKPKGIEEASILVKMS